MADWKPLVRVRFISATITIISMNCEDLAYATMKQNRSAWSYCHAKCIQRVQMLCLKTCQNEESLWEFCKDVTYSWMSLTSFPTSFSFHSFSFSLPGTESCCRECTNSLAVREKSDKMNVCGALLCRMTCCKNTTVFWKVTLEMASWEWVGEGYVYYLLMTSR